MVSRQEGKTCYGEPAQLAFYDGTKDGLAVTRDILKCNATGKYAVTHYPTGLRLAWFEELWQAKAALALLGGLGKWDTIPEQSLIDPILKTTHEAFSGMPCT